MTKHTIAKVLAVSLLLMTLLALGSIEHASAAPNNSAENEKVIMKVGKMMPTREELAVQGEKSVVVYGYSDSQCLVLEGIYDNLQEVCNRPQVIAYECKKGIECQGDYNCKHCP